MDIPFDKVVLISPHELHLKSRGSSTPIELRSFGGQYPNLIWEQWRLPHAAKGAAMLFCEYTCPLFYKGRVVVANHGIYEALPEEFSWWTRMRATPLNRRSARRADRVIANSQSTKLDLVKYFGLPESKIDIIYPAPADLFFEPHSEESITEEIIRVFSKKVPYLIFVGKLAKRRHVPNLIEAFSIVRKRDNLPHHLLIIGPNVNNLPLQELAARHGVTETLKYYPHMDQQQLARLYAGAEVFVLPTTYEGISWTMFEAMASGTAVLTVDHPTLAEGGADAVLSVPSPQVEDLVQGLRALLTNQTLRKEYEEKGLARARKFSLFECAKVTMEILDKMAPPSDDHF